MYLLIVKLPKSGAILGIFLYIFVSTQIIIGEITNFNSVATPLST